MNKTSNQEFISHYIHGDTIIQLKDGRILSYYSKNGYKNINIYSQNTFHRILYIDIYLLIELQKLKKEKRNIKSKSMLSNLYSKISSFFFGEKEENLNDDDDDKNYKLLKPIISVKELNNGFILVGIFNYLIKLNIYEETYDYKIINEFEDNILNINELYNNRFILITNNQIIVLDDEYILSEKYLINDNWKIDSSKVIYKRNFNQYFSSIELPNNRLLLNSFSTELYYSYCGNNPPYELAYSKIIFINLENFEEIKKTDIFELKTQTMIFEKVIIIQNYHDIYLYNINTLDIIKKIKLENDFNYMCKFIDNYVISISLYNNINNLLIYKVVENDLVKNLLVKTKIKFQQIKSLLNFFEETNSNKKIYVLNDKRIILIRDGKFYIIKIEIN